jgi:hypothetical protein
MGQRTPIMVATPQAAEPPQNRSTAGGRFQKGLSGNPDTQFKKGQSGNPGGRPKTKPFRDALEAILKAAGPEEDLLAVARALRGQALAGNVVGIREIADRLDGKVPQAIAGTDEDGNLTPLVPVINIYGRPEPQAPSKAVDGVRKRRD